MLWQGRGSGQDGQKEGDCPGDGILEVGVLKLGPMGQRDRSLFANADHSSREGQDLQAGCNERVWVEGLVHWLGCTGFAALPWNIFVSLDWEVGADLFAGGRLPCWGFGLGFIFETAGYPGSLVPQWMGIGEPLWVLGAWTDRQFQSWQHGVVDTVTEARPPMLQCCIVPEQK